MARYQDIDPSDPLVRSTDVMRPRASDLIQLEFFEAAAGKMPRAVFDQHHMLINLREQPMQIQNWRDGQLFEYFTLAMKLSLSPPGSKAAGAGLNSRRSPCSQSIRSN